MTLKNSHHPKKIERVSIPVLGAVLAIATITLVFLCSLISTDRLQAQASQPIEVEALANLQVKNPETLFKSGEKANLIIRNQPYGQVTVTSAQLFPQAVVVPQPNGTAKALSDPLPAAQFSKGVLVTMSTTGQVGDRGVVIGNSPIKVGTPIELDSPTYNFKASVIDVRVPNP